MLIKPDILIFLHGVIAMRKIILFANVLIVSAVLVAAAHGAVPLCPNDCGIMKPEAKKYYDLAMDQMDRINYNGAIEELRKAAEQDPDHVNLHFFLAALAQDRGQMTTSLEAAQKYYTIAENALLHLSSFENLTQVQANRLATVLEVVQREKGALTARNSRRLDVGYNLIMNYMFEIGRPMEPKEEEKSPVAEGAAMASIQPSAPATSSLFSSIISSFSSPGAGTPPPSTGGSPFDTGAPVAAPSPSESAPSPFSTSGETAAPAPAPAAAPSTMTSPFDSAAPAPSAQPATEAPAPAPAAAPSTTTSPFDSAAPAPSAQPAVESPVPAPAAAAAPAAAPAEASAPSNPFLSQ